MKWCRIELESGPAYGLVEGAEVAIVVPGDSPRDSGTQPP